MTLRCLLCRVKFGPNDLSDYAANQALQAIIGAKHLALRPGLLENRFVQLPSGKQSRTNEAVPVSNVVPVERMVGDDDEDTTLLRQMWTVAERYVLSFSWCESIVSAYFGGGVAKILAIFLVNISPARPDVNEWVWIIVGDIPPAHLPLEDCESAMEAFETYIDGMKRWAVLAREGRVGTPEESVPPMDVPATPEWAEKLEIKLRVLTDAVRPFSE